MKEKAQVRFCLPLLGAVAALSPAFELHASPRNEAKFVGAVGCQSSSCHGGAGEKRSQYLTWVKQDYHFRAYAVLVNARSARMAESLSLGPAQTNPRCTVCHSPFQAAQAFTPARLTNKVEVDEGVSCESCHGPAGYWLRGHTRADWTYATRVGAGMHDLRNFYVRANTCVACHQNIDLDLRAAGHPELTFELDGQSVAEPRHWRDEDPWNGPRAWLVGQAIALREVSWALAAHRETDSALEAQCEALVWLLAKVTSGQSRLPQFDASSRPRDEVLYSNIQAQADTLARKASTVFWDEHEAQTILTVLAATNSEFAATTGAPSEVLFQRAARLVLALDRLSRALRPAKGQSQVVPGLQALFEDVRTMANFQPEKFARDLIAFRATIKPRSS